MTPKGLCVGKAKALEPMVKEIFEYKFDEAPNYSKLKHLLACFLLQHSVCPDNIFDWSKFSKKRVGSAENIESDDDEGDSDCDIDERPEADDNPIEDNMSLAPYSNVRKPWNKL